MKICSEPQLLLKVVRACSTSYLFEIGMIPRIKDTGELINP
jgi:hypothetical protein